MITQEISTDTPKKSWGRLIRNLLIMLAIIGGFTYTAFAVGAGFGWLAHPENRLAVFLTGSIVGEWVAFAVLIRINKGQNISLRDLGWRRKTNLQAFGLGLLTVVIYCGITSVNPQVGPHLLQWSLLKLLALIAAVTAGIVEETIFRGYIISSLERMKYRGFTQVLVSGLFFALAHIYGFASLISYFISLGFTFLLGVALGIVYLVGKKSLSPVILSHFLIDAVIEPWLLLSFFTSPVG